MLDTTMFVAMTNTEKTILVVKHKCDTEAQPTNGASPKEPRHVK